MSADAVGMHHAWGHTAVKGVLSTRPYCTFTARSDAGSKLPPLATAFAVATAGINGLSALLVAFAATPGVCAR